MTLVMVVPAQCTQRENPVYDAGDDGACSMPVKTKTPVGNTGDGDSGANSAIVRELAVEGLHLKALEHRFSMQGVRPVRLRGQS
eukprot:1136806-Pelagomonas_calceolata.AAC.2